MRLHVLVLVMMTLGAVAGVSAANDDKKGHGAGGVRAEHASEMGLEKGKAWAGSREAPVKEPVQEPVQEKARHQDRARDQIKEKSTKRQNEGK